jgi:hypothetical protein
VSAPEIGTRVSCPVCALAVKITRAGVYAPHGNRYTRRGPGNGDDNRRRRCRGSWFPVADSLAEIARKLDEHAAEMLARAAAAEPGETAGYGGTDARTFWTDAATCSTAAAAAVRARASS